MAIHLGTRFPSYFSLFPFHLSSLPEVFINHLLYAISPPPPHTPISSHNHFYTETQVHESGRGDGHRNEALELLEQLENGRWLRTVFQGGGGGIRGG